MCLILPGLSWLGFSPLRNDLVGQASKQLANGVRGGLHTAWPRVAASLLVKARHRVPDLCAELYISVTDVTISDLLLFCPPPPQPPITLAWPYW